MRSRRWRVTLSALLLVVGALVVAGLAGRQMLVVIWAPAAVGRGGRTPGRSAVASALARCERSLAEARAQMARRLDEGAACLRVASLEMRRSDLLALAAYERREEHLPGASDAGPGDYPAWRRAFLRGDPDGSLARVTQAARAALRAKLDPRSRRQALLLLADARSKLGDYRGEAEALAEAARREPDQAGLWLRLAEAYGRAGRFADAEAARGRGLDLLERGR